MAKLGIEKKKSEPINNKIIGLIVSAVNMTDTANGMEDYLIAAGIPEISKDAVDVRLVLAKKVNDFVNENSDKANTSIKSFEFIKELIQFIKKHKV